ncbi:MAG TPA: TetR/AcrR family transcriptional regulator [Bosea sp. (in: a-proteobacteria)]|jgi:AcrR family transcriptional regulator|uniref:TetR/AcrR family transcriptional regulator n=1 Tax=Bosea sp. (in: a-proteobacteria) TaxID=1871050 RepID=UPI002E0E4887|nr:TetR/AcrR family transcriptional regulator [Bosea sp. (in: a-proteobacteria)]
MQKSGGQDLGIVAVKEAVRSRGRPRAFDREAALDTATRLFWRKGYAATSISDLTEAMGISSPSLYAAFGSKEQLYAEALRHFGERFEALVWGNFRAASTAHDAIAALLMDSAAALSGSCGRNDPLGCMVTLSAVGSEGHAELGERVRAARAMAVTRVEQRLGQAVADGELEAGTDVPGLARFFVAVQNGMSILARDGAGRAELEAAARHAMRAWPGAVRT